MRRLLQIATVHNAKPVARRRFTEKAVLKTFEKFTRKHLQFGILWITNESNSSCMQYSYLLKCFLHTLEN